MPSSTSALDPQLVRHDSVTPRACSDLLQMDTRCTLADRLGRQLGGLLVHGTLAIIPWPALSTTALNVTFVQADSIAARELVQ